MTTATRRGFVAGAVAGVAVPRLARPAGAVAAGGVDPQARREVVRRGRALAVAPRGDVVIVAHDQRRTVEILGPRGGVVDVDGQPVSVAIAPDGRAAAVVTASWDHPGLVAIDLTARKVRGRSAVGPAPFDVAFTPDGRRIVVVGGEQEGTVHLVHAARLEVLRSERLGLLPRGVAVAPDGRSAWVVLQGLDQVVRVDVRSGKITREVETAPLPDRVAVAPDGRRLLVSHGGHGVTKVSEVDLATGEVRRREAGAQPCAVAFTRGGTPLVTLRATGEVVVLGRRRRRLRVGGSPRGLAVAGRRAFTVDALTGAVGRVRP